MRAIKNRRRDLVQGRRIRKGLVGVMTAGALLVSAAPALANVTVSTPGGQHEYTASASQSGWTGTVSVNGYVWGSGCVTVSEQGHNFVAGYGAWKTVTSACGSVSRSFSFSVSDFYSDSVAVKICDASGCRSTHVWG